MKLISNTPKCALFLSVCGFVLFVNGCGKSSNQPESEPKTADCETGTPKTVPESDNNHNHLADKYETVASQGKSCIRHSDCDTEPGKGDGFCDSLIGYQCSTRCSADEQCVQTGEEYASGKTFHYYCRNDGRCVPQEFVTDWNFKWLFSKKIYELKLPAQIEGIVDWGDGTQTPCSTDKICSHTYQYDENAHMNGNYTIAITGKITNWSFPETEEFYDTNDYLADIKSFGPLEFGKNAFAGTSSLSKISAVDIPNPNDMNTLEKAFWGSSCDASNISLWDTSNVTNMGMTFGESAFNQSLDNWNTSLVTNMNGMFLGNNNFNQPLEAWDTSNVTDMGLMFSHAKAFNQPLNQWNTAKVTNMNGMFSDAESFNQSLDKWNTSHVTEMCSMFKNTKSFIQDISHWDYTKVECFNDMFAHAQMTQVKDSNDPFCLIYKSIHQSHKDVTVFVLNSFFGGVFGWGGFSNGDNIDIKKICNIGK